MRPLTLERMPWKTEYPKIKKITFAQNGTFSEAEVIFAIVTQKFAPHLKHELCHDLPPIHK